MLSSTYLYLDDSFIYSCSMCHITKCRKCSILNLFDVPINSNSTLSNKCIQLLFMNNILLFGYKFVHLVRSSKVVILHIFAKCILNYCLPQVNSEKQCIWKRYINWCRSTKFLKYPLRIKHTLRFLHDVKWFIPLYYVSVRNLFLLYWKIVLV